MLKSRIIYRSISSTFICRNNSSGGVVDTMNSLRTLPQVNLIKSAEEIQKDLIKSRTPQQNKFFDPALIKFKQSKNIFSFFKEGLLNIWRTNRDLKKSLFNNKRYIYDFSMGDENGKLIIKRGDFDKIIDVLSQRVKLIQVEFENGKRLSNSVENEILINRKEFVEMIRLRKDFIKLPLFGLLFLILEEASLPLIYLFPRLIPSTCVLPGILSKRYYKKRNEARKRLDEINNGKGSEFVQKIVSGETSVWKIDESLVPLVCDALEINHTFSRVKLMREKLEQHRKMALVERALRAKGAVSHAEQIWVADAHGEWLVRH
ncbi:hypothetical protein DAMA08_032580 [Martiniozyma asiatica (nom. inval.)]|nr:hypothetical protein DAMA08_032580 [Martiniozyma asiatica]